MGLVSKKDHSYFYKLVNEFYVDINSMNLAISKTVCETLGKNEKSSINSKLNVIPNGLRNEGIKNTSSLTFDTCIKVFERGDYVQCDIDTNDLNCDSLIRKIPEIKSVIGQELHIRESQIYFQVNTSHSACQTQMQIVQLGSKARANSTRYNLGKLHQYTFHNLQTDSEEFVLDCGCSIAAADTLPKANMNTFLQGLFIFGLGVLSVIYTSYRSVSWLKKNEKEALESE